MLLLMWVLIVREVYMSFVGCSSDELEFIEIQFHR